MALPTCLAVFCIGLRGLYFSWKAMALDIKRAKGNMAVPTKGVFSIALTKLLAKKFSLGLIE